MRAAGVTAAVAMARANISPWQVLWWILMAVVIIAGTVYVLQYTRRWWQGRGQQRGWPTSAVVLTGSGCSLLVWGMLAGWATLP